VARRVKTTEKYPVYKLIVNVGWINLRPPPRDQQVRLAPERLVETVSLAQARLAAKTPRLTQILNVLSDLASNDASRSDRFRVREGNA
jgi:hypothetical protein